VGVIKYECEAGVIEYECEGGERAKPKTCVSGDDKAYITGSLSSR